MAPQEVLEVMGQATQDLIDQNLDAAAPKVGDKLAEFTLPNQNGEQVSLASLLDKGPVVLTFYRGGWCPYCNLELKALQAKLPEIKAAGATLVAITPETPDNSLNTAEKNALDFEILSDAGAQYAQSLSLVFTLPDTLKPIYANFGIDLESYNGDGVFELPIPASFVIDQDGVIKFAYVDADYTKRAEPSDLVSAL
jgi:peroxiredoxin